MEEESRFLSASGGAQHLARLAIQVMPFGKYAGSYLTDLPEGYLLWFQQRGWPRGQLGRDLQEMLEIKVAGCDAMLRQWRVRTQSTAGNSAAK
jgi:uncharacterized protein (DUF3820 family)